MVDISKGVANTLYPAKNIYKKPFGSARTWQTSDPADVSAACDCGDASGQYTPSHRSANQMDFKRKRTTPEDFQHLKNMLNVFKIL